MQVFKLVKAGSVDRLIGFDSLPENVLSGVRRGTIAGWPREWRDFLSVKREDVNAEPFYILEYVTRNADREKWQEISSYVKRNVDPSVRLLDKIEAMAKPAATDSYTDVNLEPEDLVVIPFPAKAPKVEDDKTRKRGREEVTA